MTNNRIIIATIKSWNIRNARAFPPRHRRRFHIRLIHDREQLTYASVRAFNPRFIFVPHWSWLIPPEICRDFECIVFHMTDLPFGRGGTPLQNLIIRGLKTTKISAFRAGSGLDDGPVYMKTPIRLNGSAQDIYERVSHIIFEKMIPAILSKGIAPIPQKGRAVVFKRRTPEDSRLPARLPFERFYDFIRMLDAKDYPKAFIDTGTSRIAFHNARKRMGSVEAQVTITPRRLG